MCRARSLSPGPPPPSRRTPHPRPRLRAHAASRPGAAHEAPARSLRRGPPRGGRPAVSVAGRARSRQDAATMLATAEQYGAMLDGAAAGGYAFAAINVTSSQTLNAALRGFAEAG